MGSSVLHGEGYIWQHLLSERASSFSKTDFLLVNEALKGGRRKLALNML